MKSQIATDNFSANYSVPRITFTLAIGSFLIASCMYFIDSFEDGFRILLIASLIITAVLLVSTLEWVYFIARGQAAVSLDRERVCVANIGVKEFLLGDIACVSRTIYGTSVLKYRKDRSATVPWLFIIGGLSKRAGFESALSRSTSAISITH